MVSDVPFGVLLSGGVDSSMNVALMSELMTRPVTTFTIGYEGKEDYNEFQFARRISQRYQDRPSRDADQPRGDAELPAAARAAAGRADRRQRLHPAVLPRQAREGQRHDRRAGRRGRRREFPRLLVVRALPADGRVGLPAGAAASAVVAPWPRGARRSRARRCRGEALEIQARARRGEELFWGGAVCWWGEHARRS